MSGQPKYSSLSAFQRGVADVNEQLTDGERLVMNGLAVDVDYKTGKSHPGNAALMRRSNRKERAVQEILKGLRAKGLLQMVSKGDGGRGLATEHRFCVEDSRYPEPNDKMPKPRSIDCGDMEQKPRSPERGDKTAKPRSAAEKPRSSAAETPQLDGENPAVWSAPPPKGLPTNPSSNPSKADGMDLSETPADKETRKDEVQKMDKPVDIEALFDEFEDRSVDVAPQAITLSDQNRAELTAACGKESEPTIRAGLRMVLYREKGWGGLRDCAGFVLKEFPACLRAAKRTIARQQIEEARYAASLAAGKAVATEGRNEILQKIAEEKEAARCIAEDPSGFFGGAPEVVEVAR